MRFAHEISTAIFRLVNAVDHRLGVQEVPGSNPGGHHKVGHLAAVPANHDRSEVCPVRLPLLGRKNTIENAQAIAAHESLRTTKLHDRTGDEITLDEVERIAV